MLEILSILRVSPPFGETLKRDWYLVMSSQREGVTVCSIAATVNTGSVCIGGSKPHPSGTYQSSNNLFHNLYHTA